MVDLPISRESFSFEYGHRRSLLTVPWPAFRSEALEMEKRLIALQVNGKMRSRVEVTAASTNQQCNYYSSIRG